MASQLYALHTYYTQANGRKRYYRLSLGAYTKRRAILMYQNALLTASLSGVPIELKPVREQYDNTVAGAGAIGYMAEAIYTSGS